MQVDWWLQPKKLCSAPLWLGWGALNKCVLHLHHILVVIKKFKIKIFKHVMYGVFTGLQISQDSGNLDMISSNPDTRNHPHSSSSSFVCSLNPIRQTWFIPQPLIPLLYNPFTIVLHKRLSAYLFRAAHTPACWIGTKRNKDFHPATPQPIGNQDYWPNPWRMWI